jgi:hypothetical protein
MAFMMNVRLLFLFKFYVFIFNVCRQAQVQHQAMEGVYGLLQLPSRRRSN